MKFLRRAAWMVLAFLSVPMSAPAQQHMIGYAGFAGFQASMWAVKDLGLLKKYNIDGEVVMIPGTARQIQALVGNSIDFAHLDAVGTIRAILGGADIVMVGSSLNKFPFSFVTQKEIRKPADVVGKKIGIVGFGGGNDLAVSLLLKEWNIPRQSVNVLQAGGAANRLVAMSAKALDATVLSFPEIGEARRMGMNIMSDLNELKSGDYPMSVVAVRRSLLAQNRNLVKRFLMAYAEGTYLFKTDKEKGIGVYRRRLKQDNVKALEETYQYFAPKFAFPIRVSKEGMRNTLEMVAADTPKLD
ncbi:MAG TPA: ABC transporter substrate-binding protein, partial [Candidatus Binatia bacterium]|nr:ABC transporter substrate-binding protein [Candidatus Binatia bacterium]